MVKWLFKLGVVSSVPASVGNFAAQITFISVNSFYIQNGFTGIINPGDTIIITTSSISGTYFVEIGSSAQTIIITPGIPYFPGSENVFIEVLTPPIIETVIDEPIGFSEIVFNTIRDEVWHGIFFEASTSQLSFYGTAFEILKNEKLSSGIDAVVTFTADSKCEGETDYTNVISGKLDFSNYQETCGDQCLIRLSVEQDTCAMTFKNRFDQKVNIDSLVAFDKVTNLANYDALGITMPLATQSIPISADAKVALTGFNIELSAVELYPSAPPNHQDLMMRPNYERVIDNSILTGNLDDAVNLFQDPGDTFLLTPQVLLEEFPDCINSEFTYEVRLKGNLIVNTISETGSQNLSLWAILDYWDGEGIHHGPGNLTGDAIELHREQCLVTIRGDGGDNLFDKTFLGSVNLPAGYGLYAYIKVVHVAISGPDADITADFTPNWDPETSFFLSNEKNCPPTDAQVYLINETLARVTESITDGCLTVKSDYYGRTDSQPYASLIDGCGGLRIVTPGLRIRQANDKFFFASMKELMQGLRGIDNIGMGMDGNIVRIEDLDYFYQNVKILDILLIPKSRSDIESQMVYSSIKYGYNKWEIKSIKGIDEFNSLKEARTGIKAVNNSLDITSNLIVSGYVIENLRTQTLVNSGNTDNSYDNEVFIICVERAGYSYIVEQNVTEDAANFYSPSTAYNWRIRPLYNLMRWFKSIVQPYVNLSNTSSKIFFTSGTGNYLASGQLSPYDACRLESSPLPENVDLSINNFSDAIKGTPLYKAESVSFTYPLSVQDYKNIKANPYGFVNVQCGTGEIIKAYIKSINYKPAEGTADFILIKSWR